MGSTELIKVGTHGRDGLEGSDDTPMYNSHILPLQHFSPNISSKCVYCSNYLTVMDGDWFLYFKYARSLKDFIKFHQNHNKVATYCFTWRTFYCREYSIYRVVSTSRLEDPRHLVVHDNLKTFTEYSERSVQNL